MLTKNWYSAMWGYAIYGEPKIIDQTGTERTLSTSYTMYNSRFGWAAASSGAEQLCSPTMLKVDTSTSFGRGVNFGTGTTAPTINDYCPAGEKVSTISYSVSVERNDTAITAYYTLTNTGTNPITIGEVALMASVNYSNYLTLFERTVLESPITIEPGGVGQVTYTIRMDYPVV